MLDDQNVIKQRDPAGALEVAAGEYQQLLEKLAINWPDNDGRTLTKLVVAGMGGSALAALLSQSWLADKLALPFEVVRGYDLPAYVDQQTLVIVSSYSGNTEEALSMLDQANQRGAQVAIITAGGQLAKLATEQSIASVSVPDSVQPRMAMFYMLKAEMQLLAHFGITDSSLVEELEGLAGWLGEESAAWQADAPISTNLAKQLALSSVGKTAVFYGGPLSAPLAYKWKISWNENAKNVAFWNQYPEFNHNEFLGWASHPVEKPYAVFDLISSLEHPRVLKRFELSDRLLSGKRPKATPLELRGDTILAQLLWGCILADFTSIYLAILNGVDPTPVKLIERLKQELA